MGNKSQKPQVPKGWVAVWDETYNEWFYVDESTGKSQWDAPKGTVFLNSRNDTGAPPAYSASQANPSVQQGYQQMPQQGGYYQQMPQQGGYYQQQPPQQVIYAQQPQQPKKSGFGGMGGMLGGAALGTLGGFLLADAMTPDMGMGPPPGDYGGGGFGDGGFGGNDFGGGDFGGGDFGGGF